MEHRKESKTVKICNGTGEAIEVELTPEDGRIVGVAWIDEIPYHVEEVPARWLKSRYCVDTDPHYSPRYSKNQTCFLMAPFSR